MFCTHCGTKLSDTARYCSDCGTATPLAPRAGFYRSTAGVPFSRPTEGKRIAGVCAGVARYWDLDPTLVRVLWALVSVWPPGVGILAYIVAWVLMPQDPMPVVNPAPAQTVV